MGPHVLSVQASAAHSFSKPTMPVIELLAGRGVAGDAHCGTTVKHRGRLPRDGDKANLRQVHLLHAELHDALRAHGFDIGAGSMGENITTSGIDVLVLRFGTRLRNTR